MKNEYDTLQKVLVAAPTHMKITDIINEVQKQHAHTNINAPVAMVQHQSFIACLENEGAEILHLETDPALNEQVFTRDIGFVIDDTFCVANLKEPIRKAEKQKLLAFLEREQIAYAEFEHPIEGGDVIVHEDTIFVGLSNRTSAEAVTELKNLFPHKEVVTIQLLPHILHLDCVFTILHANYALLYQEGMTIDSFQQIKHRFTFLNVTKKEQETMATNVLAIGNNKIISLTTQNRVNETLRERGFDIVEVEFSEIIKSGGSFRCCTLPLVRKRES